MKRRRLGQHYLVDERVVRRIIDVAEIRPEERVLEIGTGRGILTKELVGLGLALEGYEVDRENFNETTAVLGRTRATLHLGDVFKQRPQFDVLVASLPYSRSATFVEWLGDLKYDRAVVLLQEDFVKKILSAPGTRDYRGVSALAQISSDVRVVDRVARSSFHPHPKVSSLLVRIKPRTRIGGPEASRIKRLFSLRRRQVQSALMMLEMGTRDGAYATRRVYSLTPDEVHRLCSSTPAE